jgi:thiamine kinase-like enzyme
MMDDSNQIPRPETFNALTWEAERMLSDIFGSQIHFTHVERLSEPGRRNLILRCLSAPTNNFPSRFIIKKVEADSYNPEYPSSWDSQRFFSDWIGSQFLSSLEGGINHGPHFYGGNRDLGFIILEDMGHHRSLVEPLLHENADSAEAALFRYSTRLGKLHADTVNQYSLFEKLFHSVSSSGKSFALAEREIEESIQKVQMIIDGLGLLLKPAFLQELREIGSAVVNPGPFLVYIHADPCPDNVFDSREQMRLIDFEFGHFGHALIDATYARMIFPTCWCANRLPQSIVVQMESWYRTELSKGCSEAQEDRVWEQALVTICGYWLLHTLEWHLERALKEDQSWGIASLRQRILARLEAFVTTSEEFGRFPAVHDTAGRLLDVLGERWPETQSLPLYPAFQSA